MNHPYNNLRKKILLFPLYLFSFLLIGTLSCQKGNDGPAGPAGPSGPTGPTGATGTANVIYSDWFTPAAYTMQTVFGSTEFIYDKAVPAITQQIIDSGTVITFGKLDGYNPSIWPVNQVSALPIAITYMVSTTPNIDTWSALLTTGNLRIQLVSSLNQYTSIATSHQFRYIIIPGGVKTNVSHTQKENDVETNATGARPVNADYLHMSYTEICKQLNIPE